MGKNELAWTLTGATIIIMVPAIIMIHPYSHDIIVWMATHFQGVIGVLANIISIALCVYCLARTLVGISMNVFLPKIPMPRNKVVRIILMATVGVVIGIISSVTTLILWVITCLLGMATYSFIENYE